MTKITALIAAFFLFTFSATGFAAEREEKVIYHISDSANARNALRNAMNHLSQSPKAKIVFVTHGAGIDFLIDGAVDKNGNPYDIDVEQLSAQHVEFRVCNNTLIGRHIDKSKLLPQTSIVPSGVAEVARLQIQEGYAYIKP
jgi:hypothetical protein